MIAVDNVFDVLICMNNALFDDEEDCVHYVANASKVRDLMRCIAEEELYLPDLIQFDTENEKDYYYLTLERTDDEDIVYSIYKATDSYGMFYGMLGRIFVDNDVPNNFEKDITRLSHINQDPIRIVIDNKECSGCCDECDCESYNDDNMHGYTHSWTNDTGYHSMSFYSTSPELVKVMLEKTKF